MDYFNYKNGELFCEGVRISDIIKTHGTPAYIYSKKTITGHFEKINKAFSKTGFLKTICYSVKANANLSILNLMKRRGSGFDVTSGGELFRALKIGADPEKIVFAGVGKTSEEIENAIRIGVFLLNVESAQELKVVDECAGRVGKIQNIALRVNPDVDPHTHKYITTGRHKNKFGLEFKQAGKIIENSGLYKNINICGIHLHIGSQITSVKPFAVGLQKVHAFLNLVDPFKKIKYIDIGGGFGIWYNDKEAKTAEEIADGLKPVLKKLGRKIILEPGRFIVGNAGILVTRVLYVKSTGRKTFVICDAGMNDLIRPTLYDAYHRIWPAELSEKYNGTEPEKCTIKKQLIKVDVVGPVCESGDFFAKSRSLPEVKSGSLLAIFSTGAYGYAMSSNYNSHCRPCEIMVSDNEFMVINNRESYEDLIKHESLISEGNFQ